MRERHGPHGTVSGIKQIREVYITPNDFEASAGLESTGIAAPQASLLVIHKPTNDIKLLQTHALQ